MSNLINVVHAWINNSNDGVAALKILLVSLIWVLPLGILWIKFNPDPELHNLNIIESALLILFSYSLCFIFPIGFVAFFCY